MIDFGIQSGGRVSCEIINQLWNELLEIFHDDLDGNDYFLNIKGLQIVFRISEGDFDFGAEGTGIEKIISRGSIISIDYVIPESRWKEGVQMYDLRIYLSNAVRSCFQKLISKAEGINEVKNITKLKKDFEKGIDIFLMESQPPAPSLGHA